MAMQQKNLDEQYGEDYKNFDSFLFYRNVAKVVHDYKTAHDLHPT